MEYIIFHFFKILKESDRIRQFAPNSFVKFKEKLRYLKNLFLYLKQYVYYIYM